MSGIDQGNSVMNVSRQAGVDPLGPNELPEQGLEAYTVVLSTTAHVFSMLFGGGGSIVVILAITTRRNISKYSYTPVLALFLACCSLNFVWSPLELADLIMFHHMHSHPCHHFVAAKTAVYIFLVVFISTVIAFLSAEGIIRMKKCFGQILAKAWPASSSAFACIFSVTLTVIFIVILARSDTDSNYSYTIVEKDTRWLFLVVIVIAYCIAGLTLLVLALIIMKDAVYWEDGRPRLRQKKLKLEIPEFLISQSNACADNDGGFESGPQSPSTPQLLAAGDPETSSMKGEEGSHITDLPRTPVKSMGSRLGINMAQVLGRRRHTICQISDSSNVATTPMDPIARAKQYNYVRKYSVDISALQAQLQNPKIFREAPYQSDMDISKKSSSKSPKSQHGKPMLPLKPLQGKFDEKEEKILENEKSGAESNGAGMLKTPPPVILVFNDDAVSNDGDMNIPDEIQSSKEPFQDEIKPNSNDISNAQKQTSLDFNEPLEDHISMPTTGSGGSDSSSADSDGRRMARLAFLMSLTFVLHMLPVLVSEVLQGTFSERAFINISTCTLAVSSIQTIVYPQLIICRDEVVQRAVRKLTLRVKNVCACQKDTDLHSHAENSSSTCQT